MDVRERLRRFVKEAIHSWESDVNMSDHITDNLITHGVTVQGLDGCEYCKEDSEGFRRMFGAFSLVNPFHGKTWQIHAGKCKPREIYFCPMCGRRLPQPPKGE